MKRLFFILLVAAGLFYSSASTLFHPAFSAAPPPPATIATPSPDVKAQIEQALQQAVQSETEQVLGFLVYKVEMTALKLTPEENFAALWVVMTDPRTGESVPGEPGLAFAIRQPGSSDYQIVLPSDPTWKGTLESAPADVVSPELKADWLEKFQQAEEAAPNAPLTGYLLPWPQGQTRYLSQSVLHDKYTPGGSAHYAFDFYLSGQMWNLYAAKSGTVWMIKYDVDTCNKPTCSDTQPLGNYIVLQDTTTVPTSYQLYLHLAKESIPPALRTIGTPVLQGQFIGIADNTGQSYGSHLHFQVHTNPNSYWGQSVDITFGDVSINGGRPRVQSQYYNDQPYCYSYDPCSQFSSSYISGNPVKGDLTAPVGTISSPQLGATLNAGALSLSGFASDPESGFYSAQFVANYNGDWHDIGPQFLTSPVNYSWDLCAAGVPDGPVSVALRVMNREGSQNPFAGLVNFTKNYTCPAPPPCTVDADHVALYEDPNYRGCVTFGVGEYANAASLGNLGDNDAASIKVGANVQATLWSEEGFQGRGTTFLFNDPNLADNMIGAETTSSMKVQPRSASPQAPNLLASTPVDGAQIPGNDVVVFAWDNGGNSLEYQLALTGPTTLTTPWQAASFLRLDSLPAGSYTWKVRAQTNGVASGWSQDRHFSIATPVPPTGIPLTAPMDIPFSSTPYPWQATGLWRLVNDSGNYRWLFQNANGNYDGTGVISGTLTSPSINISQPGYFLRFSTNRQTESGLHWDQRWLQIAQDNGPFIDVLQFSDDPYNSWTQSPFINLTPYAGHNIRLRFAFSTIDSYLNSTPGWGIDDIWIHAEAPPTCDSPEEPNNAAGQATPLNPWPLLPGQTITSNGTICPAGDVDFFQFDYEGTVPITIVADIDAQTIGSALDGILYLLDGNDGSSVLAMHDDEIYGDKVDPHLAFQLKQPGRYFLKLIDWSHPGQGGPGYSYTLRLTTDSADPSTRISFPETGAWLPLNAFDLTAEASDPASGLKQVDFYYHSNQWQNTDWVFLNSDRDGSDGWSVPFNPASYPEQQGLAFYAEAFDWGGNWLGTGAWNVGIDRTAPTSALASLPASQNSTAIHLNWTGSDALSGVDHYDIQVNSGSGWTNAVSDVPGTVANAWFIGQPGKIFQFRTRGEDNAGNIELFPSAAETSITIPSTLCLGTQPYEPDNTWQQAKPLTFEQVQIRSFCNPVSGSGGLNDQDWLAIPVQAGKHYLFHALPITTDAAAELSLYRLDGSNQLVPLVSSNATELGEDTVLEWDSNLSGTVYLQIQHINGNVAGSSVTYGLQALEGYHIWLPKIFK